MRETKLFWSSPTAEKALDVAFSQGLAVLAESDTIWGLLTPTTKAGAAELDTLKKRRDKPYLVLIGSLGLAEKLLFFPDNGSYALAQKGWPGPLTLLCPSKRGMLEDAQSPAGIVGIRVPNHEPLRNAAKKYGGLFSTSANISGEPVPITFDTISESIRARVGAIIYNDPSYIPQTKPSTIVDCSGNVLKIVRQGAYNLT